MAVDTKLCEALLIYAIFLCALFHAQLSLREYSMVAVLFHTARQLVNLASNRLVESIS